jgi:transcriptional regulator of heat shock response
MRTLDDRRRLVELLEGIIATTETPHVLLGADTHGKVGYPVSVVAAPFSEVGGRAGTVGVIGPTPMDYPNVVGMVHAVADAMNAALSKWRS